MTESTPTPATGAAGVGSAYADYASGEYLEYQKKYAGQVRESDKRIVQIIREIAAGRGADRPLQVVDIGCSSGNLLLHLKHQVPGLDLAGGEAFAPIVERCRQTPELRGISFDRMDLLALERGRRFDVVVVNAVLFLFSPVDFVRAIANIAAVVRGGGHFIAFDLFHPVEQDLVIREESETHPDGLTLHFRPYSLVQGVLAHHGFTAVDFQPFVIPIDLPRPQRAGDITSHTVRTAAGDRLVFRGALYTPWCHLVARRAPAAAPGTMDRA